MFAAVHFPTALTLGFLLQSLGGRRSSGLGSVLIYMAASVVGWRFAKLHRRHFLKTELRTLIVGCLLYILIFEALGLWGSVESLDTLSATAWLGIAGFAVIIDLAAIWASFKYPVHRQMQRQLDRLGVVPNKTMESTR